MGETCFEVKLFGQNNNKGEDRGNRSKERIRISVLDQLKSKNSYRKIKDIAQITILKRGSSTESCPWTHTCKKKKKKIGITE